MNRAHACRNVSAVRSPQLHCTTNNPICGQSAYRFSRCVAAHLGRFLPRLGPFVSSSGPSLCRDASDLVRPRAQPLPSYAVTAFCNAKGFACILCAAHLNKFCEAGDFVAGLVALLGRFLPRLGPHGPPRGPFYFLAGARVRPTARGPAQRLRSDATMPSSPAFTRRSIAAPGYCDAI